MDGGGMPISQLLRNIAGLIMKPNTANVLQLKIGKRLWRGGRMIVDYDDPDIAELIAMDRYDRRLMARLLSHPDPRDPDYPLPEEEPDDE